MSLPSYSDWLYLDEDLLDTTDEPLQWKNGSFRHKVVR
ncbi:unnamed protein product [Ectocarpus sp. 6 AP-2014]